MIHTRLRFFSFSKIKVTVYIEHMYEDLREKAIKGLSTMVAIEESRKPAAIG